MFLFKWWFVEGSYIWLWPVMWKNGTVFAKNDINFTSHVLMLGKTSHFNLHCPEQIDQLEQKMEWMVIEWCSTHIFVEIRNKNTTSRVTYAYIFPQNDCPKKKLAFFRMKFKENLLLLYHGWYRPDLRI